MIRVNDQSQLWAHSYEHEFTGLLALQREIGSAIAKHIQVALAPNYTNPTSEKYAPNSEAYELYLQGLSHLEKRTEDELKRSVDCFRRSTEKDVRFALAYAGLASAYLASTPRLAGELSQGR